MAGGVFLAGSDESTKSLTTGEIAVRSGTTFVGGC
jgi:hypothetical protein